MEARHCLLRSLWLRYIHGNYNVILGRDWVHANQCVPCTMHQFLIQWVEDKVEIIYANTSVCLALGDAMVDWQHPKATCLTGHNDLPEFDFLSATKNGSVPVMLKSGGGDWLKNIFRIDGS